MADAPKNKIVDVTIRAKTAGFEEVSQKVKSLNDQASRGQGQRGTTAQASSVASSQRRAIEEAIASLTPEERKAGGPGVEYLKGAAASLGIPWTPVTRKTVVPSTPTQPSQSQAGSFSDDAFWRREIEAQRAREALSHQVHAPGAGSGGRRVSRGGASGQGGGGGGLTVASGFGDRGGVSGRDGIGSDKKEEFVRANEMRVRQRGIVQMSALAYAASTLAMSFMDVDGATNKMVRGMQSAAMSMQIVGGITGGRFGGGMIVAGGILSMISMAVAAIKGQEAREALNLLGRNSEKDDELDHLKGLIAQRNRATTGSARWRKLDDEINDYAEGVQSRERIAEERQRAEGYIAANRTPEEAAEKEASEMRELARQMRSRALAPGNAVEQGMSATLLKESNQLMQAASRRLEEISGNTKEISGNTKDWKDFAWEIIGANSNSVRPISIGEMRRSTPTMQGLTITVAGDGYLAQMASSIAHQVNEYYLRQLYPNMAG